MFQKNTVAYLKICTIGLAHESYTKKIGQVPAASRYGGSNSAPRASTGGAIWGISRMFDCKSIVIHPHTPSLHFSPLFVPHASNSARQEPDTGPCHLPSRRSVWGGTLFNYNFKMPSWGPMTTPTASPPCPQAGRKKIEKWVEIVSFALRVYKTEASVICFRTILEFNNLVVAVRICYISRIHLVKNQLKTFVWLDGPVGFVSASLAR